MHPPAFPFGRFKEPPFRFNFERKCIYKQYKQGLSFHTQSEAMPRKLAQTSRAGSGTSCSSRQPTRTKKPSPPLWKRPPRTPVSEGHMDPGWRCEELYAKIHWTVRSLACSPCHLSGLVPSLSCRRTARLQIVPSQESLTTAPELIYYAGTIQQPKSNDDSNIERIREEPPADIHLHRQ
jgi:hypothetical protein